MRAQLQAAADSVGERRLDHLIEAWRACPHPTIAALVRTYASSLPPSLHADPSDFEAWMQLAQAQPGSRARGELLDRIDTNAWPRALEQVDVIATWPADPRVPELLRELLVRAPWRSHPSRPLWTRIYTLLRESDDPRVRVDLPDVDTYANGFPRAETKRWVRARFAELREQLAERAELAPLDADALALLDRCRPSVSAAGSSEDDLIAQIYANPDDDGPRAVLADYLSNRGDPRGEFIALQLLAKLGKPERARLAALLGDHKKAWLGELADIMLIGKLSYARGFPARGSLDGAAARAAIERLTGHPAWRTFVALDVRGDWPGYVEYLSHDAFHGLRELTTVGPSALSGFVEPAPRALRRLVVSGEFDGSSSSPALLEGHGMPALETLGMIHWIRGDPDSPNLELVLGSPLGQRLTRLEILQSSNYAGAGEAWVARLLAAEHRLPSLAVTCPKGFHHGAGFGYELQRDVPGPGWSMTATYRIKSNQVDTFAALAELLTALPKHLLTAVTIKTPRYEVDPAAKAELQRACRAPLTWA